MKTVLIAGASGLVGAHLLQLLLDDPGVEQVLAIGRSPLTVKHQKLKSVVADFERLDEIAVTQNFDAIFSCLGTTRSKTPDKKKYFAIEHDYPLALAQLGLAHGATQFHYISSMGANAKSMNAYARNKGLAEQSLSALHINSVYLYRPSLILGERREKRTLEKIAGKIMEWTKPLMVGALRKSRPIEAETIARAMLQNAQAPKHGVHVLNSEEIEQQVNPTTGQA